MSLNWLFEIGTIGSPDYRLALSTETYSGNAYTGAIDPQSFRGVQLNRIKAELGNIPKSTVSFKVIDTGGAYTAANFEGKPVVVRFLEDGTQTDSWRFTVETASKAYGEITINCVDFMSTLIEGYWPLTPLITDLFPEAALSSGSDSYSNVDKKACVPVVFGTSAYIPLQSISEPADPGNIYFILGMDTGSNTFVVNEITSPHALDGQTAYASPTYLPIYVPAGSGVKTFRPTIAGAYRYWIKGSNRVPPLVQYTDSAFSSIDNPVDILKIVLKDCGAVDGDFDATWGTTATTVGTTRGITFSRGYYEHYNRKDVILDLLKVSDCTIYFGDSISIAVNSKTSAVTMTSADVIKDSIGGTGTFRNTKVKPGVNDSGYVQFSKTGVPQDKVIKALVTASSTTANPVEETFNAIGILDSQDAQALAQLYFQRKLSKVGEVTFTALPSHIARRPGDVITITDDLYGGSGDVLIDSMFINADSTIVFTCVAYSVALLDFSDISPGAVSDTVASATGGLTGALDNATILGEAFMDGSYINADIVKVNSTLIVGNVDFATQIGGAQKPANNADVTSANTAANTAALGSYAAAVYNDWVIGGTLIAGGYIQTGTISLDRIIGTDGASVTFSNSTGMVFADGADLELQSTQDSTGMLTLTRGAYTYDIRTLSSGTYLLVAGRTAGCNIQIGTTAYTAQVLCHGSAGFTAYAGITTGAHTGVLLETSVAYIKAFTTAANGIYYVYTDTFFRANPNGTASAPTLGDSTHRWGKFWGRDIDVQDITFSADSTYYIGTNTVRPAGIYSDFVSCTNAYAVTLAMTGHISFTADSAYYIGANTYRPAGIYTDFLSCQGNITFSTDSSYYIGTTDYRPYNIYTDRINVEASILPKTPNSCIIGSATDYFSYVYVNYLYYKNADTFDDRDDLAELQKIVPERDEKGEIVTNCAGFGKIEISSYPRDITNIDKLPSDLKKEYGIVVNRMQLEGVLDGDKGVALRFDIPEEKRKRTAVQDEEGIVTEVLEPSELIIDKQFIKDRMFLHMGRNMALVVGGVNQLTKEVWEDVQGTIEVLAARITKLEGGK